MAGKTSCENGKKGGRPKSRNTLTAEVKRESIAEWIAPHMKPMVMAQVKKAKKGDTKAFSVLCDRAYGRSVSVQESKNPKFSFNALVAKTREDYKSD